MDIIQSETLKIRRKSVLGGEGEPVDVIDHVIHKSREYAEKAPLPPIAVVANADQAIVFPDVNDFMQTGESKDALVEVLRSACREIDATEFLLVSEIWCARFPSMEDRGQAPASLADVPGRTEALMVVHQMPHRRYVTAYEIQDLGAGKRQVSRIGRTIDGDIRFDIIPMASAN